MNVTILDIIAITTIGLLGMGFVFRHRDRHILRAGGYVLFGLFWALRAQEFSYDMVNFLFAVLALPFFAVLGMEEYSSYRGGEAKKGMDMLSGGIFFGFALYFMMARVPVFSGAIIESVARHTVLLLNALGGEYTAGAATHSGWASSGFLSSDEVRAPILDKDGFAVVNIILACTGVQSMMIFAGPIMSSRRADLRTRLSGVLLVAPTIYILNIFRNTGIVIMLENGYSFYIAHDVIGKAGSLGAMLVLAFITFKLVPGLLDDVEDIISIFIRRKPRSQPAEPSPPPPENPQEPA